MSVQVDRAAKKRILLSTTTKGLVQRYLSTHLDSSSRLDPTNRCHWRAPLSPRGNRMVIAFRAWLEKEVDSHLSYRVASHWAGPRQGVSLRCAQLEGFRRRIALQSCPAPTSSARIRRALAYVTTNRIESSD